jgi:hypothetical protein
MAGRISLDVENGVYNPDYSLTFYKNGDPRKPIRSVDLGSALSIQTSKSLNDISGTWSVTLKDGSLVTPSGAKRRRHGLYARNAIDQMDVAAIRLRGHDGSIHPVLHGVVDDVRQGGGAGLDSASDNTTIEGRCMAKYLQETSLFLPVWDPSALLPTALIFGLGAASNALYPNGKNMPKTPRGIFGALCDAFTYGKRNRVGESGIPNSRFWLNRKKRFGTLDYLVPFLQFNEDTMATVFKSFEILGFTEAWVDETGNTVYRHPQWDAPADYSISTGSLIDWDFSKADPEATYVEVTPGGSLLLDTAITQALMAGRAPVPESYITSGKGKNDLGKYVDSEFVIDTDRKGHVTAKGRRNFWYQQQRQYGLRPLQITSPLIATQAQAQAQAEGLLRFMSRFQKSGRITIPGQSCVRLGRNILIHGELDGIRFNRTYYIEGVSQSYTEGEGYTTTLDLTHGRDPGEPRWGQIALPQTTVADVVSKGGVLKFKNAADVTGPAGKGNPDDQPAQKVSAFPLPKGWSLIGTPYAGSHAKAFNVAGGSDNWQSENAVDLGTPKDTPVMAVGDGTISQSYGFGLMDGGTSSRFAGYRLHLETSDNVWYYTHLDRFARGIKPGAKVEAGQVLGYSGIAAGSPHLHLACKNGNPQKLLGV